MLCIRCHRELPGEALYCPYCGKRQGPAPRREKAKRARRAPGSGNIHKLPGKRSRPYAARMGQYVIGTYATEGEAVVALADFVARGKPLESGTATFAQIYEAWKTIHFEGISPKTEQGYKDAYARAGALHKRKMRDLRTVDYQKVIDALVAEGKSYSLCCKQQGLFTQLCAYALERDLIDKDYAAFVKLPKKPAPKQRVLSSEEQKAIWQVAKTPGPQQQIAQIAVVLICTGMRINELLRLPASDVHLEEGYAVGGEKTAAGKGRVIPLPAVIQDIVSDWLTVGAPYLLTSRAGTPLDDSNVRHRFSRLMESLGIEGVTPHTCRHTCATEMAAAGVPPRAIQSIMGHASYSTTASIYTHPGTQMLITAASQVAWNGTEVAQMPDKPNPDADARSAS